MRTYFILICALLSFVSFGQQVLEKDSAIVRKEYFATFAKGVPKIACIKAGELATMKATKPEIANAIDMY